MRRVAQLRRGTSQGTVCAPHFADEQTEVQRWGVTGPRSQNESVVAPDLTQLNQLMATTVASRKLFHGKHKVRLAQGHPAPEEGAAEALILALQPAEIYIAHEKITCHKEERHRHSKPSPFPSPASTGAFLRVTPRAQEQPQLGRVRLPQAAWSRVRVRLSVCLSVGLCPSL